MAAQQSFSDAELHDCQDFATKLAIDAGRIICAGFFQERKQFSQKTSHDDLVTETDGAVEKFVFLAIAKKYPTHKFVGEEATEAQRDKHHHVELTDEPTWMIDPIDGTMNFVHAYPDICLSMGLVVKKKPVLGVIYNPVKNELYSARVGGGAYRNGKPIHVSQVKELASCLMTTEFGFGVHLMTKFNSTAQVLPKMLGMRATGSTALNMVAVATGAADCNYEIGLHAWDMAAATIIIREAGGVVLDLNGSEFDIISRRVLCANSADLAQQLATKLDKSLFDIPRD